MKEILLILSFIIVSNQIVGSQKQAQSPEKLALISKLTPYFDNHKCEEGGEKIYDMGKLRIAYPSGIVRTKYPDQIIKVEDKEGLFMSVDRDGRTRLSDI